MAKYLHIGCRVGDARAYNMLGTNRAKYFKYLTHPDATTTEIIILHVKHVSVRTSKREMERDEGGRKQGTKRGREGEGADKKRRVKDRKVEGQKEERNHREGLILAPQNLPMNLLCHPEFLGCGNILGIIFVYFGN